MSGGGNGEGDTPGRRRRRRKPRTPPSNPAPGTQQPAEPKTDSTTSKVVAGGKAKRGGSRTKRAAAPKGPVLKEVSAGGVVYRRNGDEIEVILASRRTRRGELAWGLAKGGIEEGESLEPQFVPALRHERAEPGHEQPQHLVDIDDHQRPLPRETQVLQQGR